MYMEESKFGVRTKYLRAEYHASVKSGWETPKFDVAKMLGTKSLQSVSFAIPLRDVYVQDDGEKKMLYTWLSKEEFRWLGLPGNTRALQPWLSALDLEYVAI